MADNDDKINISELDPALTLDNTSETVVNKEVSGSWVTFKMTIATLAAHILEAFSSSSLRTTNKTVVGAINELQAGGGGGGSSTLAGLTDVNLTSPTNNQVLKYDSASEKWINGSGGGGSSADHITLTQAEYDALVEAGTVDPDAFYFIKDTNGDGQNFQPIIYSLEEREIGVWTDGKPLYEKTFAYSGSYTGSVNLDNQFSNIDSITVSNAFAVNQADAILPLPYSHSDVANGQVVNAIGFFVNSSKTGFGLLIGSNQTLSYVQITIQYTKTTDVAGSGTWTPQGVPAVHYSTDERVVGTWVDGSSLYEKTYTITAPDNGTTANLVDISDLNIDTVIDISGYLKSTNNITYKDDGFRAWIRLKANPLVDNKDFIAMQVTNADYYSQSGNLTIRYTKSTS